MAYNDKKQQINVMKKLLLSLMMLSTVCVTTNAFAQYNFWYKIEKTTGFKNTGSTGSGSTTTPTTPTDTTTTPTTPTPTPTPVKTEWEKFAEAKGLSKDWANLPWGGKKLTTLPSGPYPLTTVNDISLNENSLTNVDGLRGITTVTGSLNLYIGILNNVNGLVDVTFVGGNISVRNNNMTDVTGFRNIQVKGIINIDKSYSGPKMEANSRFCTLNAASQFPSIFAPKTQVCK